MISPSQITFMDNNPGYHSNSTNKNKVHGIYSEGARDMGMGVVKAVGDQSPVNAPTCSVLSSNFEDIARVNNHAPETLTSIRQQCDL